jgi:DNA-binding CsgD family transcriptional regulator
MGSRNEIVGREVELAAIERFLDGGPSRLLTINGAAGIGKTTLWSAAVERARELGYRVLACRPAETERDLSFAGLTALMSDAIVDELAPYLPGPRHRALEIALHRMGSGDATAGPTDIASAGPFPSSAGADAMALGLAVLGVFRLLAAAQPVLIAMDDLQWWDPATGETVAFALRRLTVEPVAVIGAVRSGIGGGSVQTISGAFAAERRSRVEVEPLSVGSVGRLLAERLAMHFPRPVLRRLCDATGCNPFLALELARTLAMRDVLPAAGEPFPVPADLDSLVGDRLEPLSSEAREAVLIVAALARPSVRVLERLMGPDTADRALHEALASGMLRIDGDQLRADHPLIASAVYARALPAERRRLHRRLAAAVSDEEQRARHLALGSDGPNAAVATALDQAARVARGRGALATAVELRSLSVELTPTAAIADRVRRHLDLASDLLACGQLEDARIACRAVVASLPPGTGRVAALLRLADVEVARDDRQAAVNWCEQALLEAGDDPALAARCHAALASSSPYDVDRETTHARAAIEMLAGREELAPAAVATALCTLATNDLWAGRGFDRTGFERAMQLEPLLELPVLARPSTEFGAVLMRVDAFDESRRLLEGSLAAAIAVGDEASRVTILLHLVGLETLTANLPAAAARLATIRELQAECGFEIRLVAAYQALVDALRGEVDAAREGAVRGLAAAKRDNDDWSVAVFARPLGFLSLSLGDAAEAVEQLSRAVATFAAFRVVEPNTIRLHADLVEALVLADRMADAEDTLAAFEARAHAHGFPWSLATSARARALVLAARGDLTGAGAAIDRALQAHAGLAMPFELARTSLVGGTIARRAKRRALARQLLEDAITAFDSLGTSLWAAQARQELGRVSGRRASPTALSDTERQVAELVASGHTNREAATELFLSVRTVEGHLARVYGKLGIRGRTQLAQALARQG